RLRFRIALEYLERIARRVALECEQVLARLGLPAACAFPDDDAIAHGADREARQRHRLRKMAPQFAHRASDPATRHVRRGEGLRSAQDDQVLERESPRVARATL